MTEKTKKQSGFHIEPFLWAAFGNGGTVSAILLPIAILLFGLLLPMGFYDPALLYKTLHGFYSNILGKLIIFMFLSFNLWHACHRIYHGLHDLEYHPSKGIKCAIYSIAGIGTLMILYYLF